MFSKKTRYYHPKREVRLKAEEKGISKGTLLFVAVLTFVGSIFIGRWVGIKLLESRTGIKSPAAAIQGYPAPTDHAGMSGDQPSTAQNGVDVQRQNISSPSLVIPPPVVEPKISTSRGVENSSDEESTAPRAGASAQPPTEETPIDKPPPKTATVIPKEKSTVGSTLYKVQTGLFSTVDNARELVSSLEKQGYNATFESVTRPDGAYYRVWVGPFNHREEAESTAQELNGNGYQAFVLEESVK